ASDEMEIHSPPDRIARISRLIGTDGEVTGFHPALDRPSKIHHVADLGFVDFLDDGPDLDAGIVGPRAPDHFEYRDALCPFKLQFLFNVLVYITDDHAEFFSQ